MNIEESAKIKIEFARFKKKINVNQPLVRPEKHSGITVL